MVITEALAEIKTIQKRIEKKKEFVLNYVLRPEKLRDPLEKEGGSASIVQAERQAIADLETRSLTLRRAIYRASDETNITIQGFTRTMTDWLIWRREISEGQQSFLRRIRVAIDNTRSVARKSGGIVSSESKENPKDGDFVVNVNETGLATEAERLETILGELDGQLSLKNATVQIREAA